MGWRLGGVKHEHLPKTSDSTRVSMEVIVTIVSKLDYFTYLLDVSNLLL